MFNDNLTKLLTVLTDAVTRSTNHCHFSGVGQLGPITLWNIYLEQDACK